ncbi:MAG: OadG family protein [Sinobacterium sp.]|nr:OadG family protein [Sinobacterium sp.]
MQNSTVNHDLFQEGIQLMIYGMGTVFVFLAVLVVVTISMSYIVNRFFPDVVQTIEPKTRSTQPAATSSDDSTLLAVITAAVHQYRSNQK